jgi:hypothetical protein
MFDEERLHAIFGPGEGEYYSSLPPAQEGEHFYWGAYPADELAYEEFIRWILLLGDRSTANPVPARPFSLDALDLGNGEPVRFRHGIVDWANERENTPLLRGKIAGGWIDPDCLHVGGFSYVRNKTRKELGTFHPPTEVSLERREFSFVTLAAPTWIEDRSRGDETLINRLILPVVELKGTPHNTLYGWLDLMFAFASGDELVYYSRYAPSRRILALAQEHGVQLTHISLVHDHREGDKYRGGRSASPCANSMWLPSRRMNACSLSR